MINPVPWAIRMGNALNGVEILSADANFEWFYGLSGATKASTVT